MNDKKLYSVIKKLLQDYPLLRGSDKLLIWNVWGKLGYVYNGYIKRDDFLKCPTPESITRCRRKIQEHYPGLRASAEVVAARRKKELTKGTFVFQEELEI